jgi:hypothetical protein
MAITFEFYRYRFHFRALDQLHLPRGKSANIIRGAFGNILHGAVPPAVYTRLFEPGAALAHSPSGLSDWPRPFVLRVAHLDGLTIGAGEPFYLDAHVFDLHEPALEYFRAALVLLADKGLGPGRGRAELERTEQLDLIDGATAIWDVPGPASVLSLEPQAGAARKVTLRFVTPTELKAAGALTGRPEFPVLFGRLRDRVSTLRALYGAGPMELDFRGLGERAGSVKMTNCSLAWEQVQRRSGRTGQVHSIGGFTGSAVYEGELGEFLPWLRAARWVGVGRQTVWGKGDVRVAG